MYLWVYSRNTDHISNPKWNSKDFVVIALLITIKTFRLLSLLQNPHISFYTYYYDRTEPFPKDNTPKLGFNIELYFPQHTYQYIYAVSIVAAAVSSVYFPLSFPVAAARPLALRSMINLRSLSIFNFTIDTYKECLINSELGRIILLLVLGISNDLFLNIRLIPLTDEFQRKLLPH